jgi:LemA protein
MDLWIFLGIVVVIAAVGVMIYNRLVALRQKREQAFADIDVQLKQRFDLVPQLVETVKAYAGHEKQILEEVTAARAGVSDARGQGIDKQISAENALTKAMFGLYAVAENYPDLKANENFQQLMSELSDIENKLAAARRFFNNATSELNTAVEQFPAVLIAGPLGFQQQTFFEIDENQRDAYEDAPNISFN